jgi:hypothetical protein
MWKMFNLQIQGCEEERFTERESVEFSLFWDRQKKHAVAINYLTPLVSPGAPRCGDGFRATSVALCAVQLG